MWFAGLGNNGTSSALLALRRSVNTPYGRSHDFYELFGEVVGLFAITNGRQIGWPEAW